MTSATWFGLSRANRPHRSDEVDGRGPIMDARESDAPTVAGGGQIRPARALWLLPLLGLLTGLIEGGFVALQQRFHQITFASPDVLWMAPVAYALIFGLTAAPMVLLAWLMPRWGTTRVILVLGIGLGSFSLLALWTGTRLSPIAVVLLSLGAGVQLGRVLAPLADRHHRRLFLLTGVLCGIVAVMALGTIARERWQRGSAGRDGAMAARADTPNVLVIILDTVRAASLSLYGYERPTSPRLTEFARGGVVFDSAFAIAPWTLPSHGSLFTGLYHQDLATDWEAPLEDGPRTLAEAFAASGYATAGFVGNLLYASRETGLGRGFGTYRDYMRTPRQLLLSASLYSRTLAWLRGTARPRRSNDRKDDGRVSAEFLEWLDQRRPERFFVFLNYYDPHLPRPRVPTRSEWHSDRHQRVDRYDAALAGTDAQVGDLLDSLAARGELDSTLVVIAADHGELLGEHGLLGHGNSLYLPLLHVPLLLRGPGIPAGHRVGRVVSLRDLAETIRDVAGLSRATRFPGTSLRALWTDEPVESASPPLAQVTQGINTPGWEPVTLGTMTTIIANGYQYVLGGRGREELFQLDTDPGEIHGLATDPGRQAILDEMRDTLRQLKRPGWGGAPDIPAHGTPGDGGS